MLAIVSMLFFAAAAAVRVYTPSPFAPRVHVRWSTSVESDQRAALERRFSLVNGQQRDADTWEYDLADPSPVSITALIQHPDVADTHYLDRATGSVSPDAPIGTVRLNDRWFAALVHSIVFDWLLLFWASSVIVSGVWLASAPGRRE
jgi:hypothetical protein